MSGAGLTRDPPPPVRAGRGGDGPLPTPIRIGLHADARDYRDGVWFDVTSAEDFRHKLGLAWQVWRERYHSPPIKPPRKRDTPALDYTRQGDPHPYRVRDLRRADPGDGRIYVEVMIICLDPRVIARHRLWWKPDYARYGVSKSGAYLFLNIEEGAAASSEMWTRVRRANEIALQWGLFFAGLRLAIGEMLEPDGDGPYLPPAPHLPSSDEIHNTPRHFGRDYSWPGWNMALARTDLIWWPVWSTPPQPGPGHPNHQPSPERNPRARRQRRPAPIDPISIPAPPGVAVSVSGDGVFLTYPFDAALNAAVKSAGGRWSADGRAWYVGRKNLPRLRAVFESLKS
ncbi:hypothetical protein [uncultured Brevundimonas sp.]|uniref:hypothetical protein n=1 Tax=uncultured Brevundimonas sp. TaxID=213418 RepID=UPI002622B2B9|nr:hypothetical protein [uncultured Brevundimonas sp.]